MNNEKNKTAAILLNYNDAFATVSAAEQLLKSLNIDLVVLVDNASTDDSRTVLRKFVAAQQKQDADVLLDQEQPVFSSDESTAPMHSGSEKKEEQWTGNRKPMYRQGDRLLLIENEKNGGYGYGNNRGVSAAANADCKYAMILNPDVRVPEETILKMKKALAYDDTAAAGARMEGQKATDCAWPLLAFEEELLFNGPLTKRLFCRRVNYPKRFFKLPEVAVGAVHGSLLMVKIPDFLKAGGFDEDLFLFMEEKVLGQKLNQLGRKLVLTDGSYRHEGSETMKKQGMDAVKRQKQRQKSERIYYKKYLGADKSQMMKVYLQQALVMLETRLAAALKLI